MATITHAIGTADTGATPNTSGAFTPALGDVLVVFVCATGTVQAACELTSSVGMTFSQFLRATFAGSTQSLYGLISNQRVTNAASQTVTADMSTDAATGTVIFVERIAGLYRTGLSAVRQSAKTDNAGAITPTASFARAARTENPTLGCVFNATNPATITPPTSWTEPATTGDLGYASPTAGAAVAIRDSGFTGTAITWGAASASNHCVMIVEIDTRPAARPHVTSQALNRASSW